MAATIQLTFDALSPKVLGFFWLEVLGYAVDPPPGGELGDPHETWDAWVKLLTDSGRPELVDSAFVLVDPEGKGPRIFIQRVAETKTAKNRLHIDVRSAVGLEGDQRMARLEEEASRLVGLGATRLHRFEPNPPTSDGFIVMADPEGNEFCLD